VAENGISDVSSVGASPQLVWWFRRRSQRGWPASASSRARSRNRCEVVVRQSDDPGRPIVWGTVAARPGRTKEAARRRDAAGSALHDRMRT
jgi:hypothetical protein